MNLQLGELGLASQKAKNGISDEGPEMAVCLAKPLQTFVRAPLCVRKGADNVKVLLNHQEVLGCGQHAPWQLQ